MRLEVGHRVTQPLVVTRHFRRKVGREGAPVLVAEGRALALVPGEEVAAGSGRECRIRLPDPHVSGRHASFTRVGGEVVVRDLGSRNGVWVDGKAVREVRLGPGQVVVLGQSRVLIAAEAGTARYPDAVRWAGMLARDPRSMVLLGELAEVASSDAPVWLCGESGTGKEVASQVIHEVGPRRAGPRVAINCAALPGSLADAELFGVVRGAFTGADRSRPGAFQRAHGGTLLLDEIGELGPEVQAKLLRVLETGEVLPVGGDAPVAVDVRIIAATWRDLARDAASGRFRFDLLQRIWVLRVDLPALRDRPGDVGPLLETFLGAGAAALWPSAAALERLERDGWPGNVRELANRAERARVSGRAAALETGGPASGASAAGGPIERARAAIAAARGNRSAAARALGVSRSTLYRWLEGR
ncbi:MAG: sigma 54-interacting transcriptional regulator [Deltaproteobacteria bacterium]|nr:sigma 54-interacting transcriptional regulator [Deltaproteobacteria bacterium]MCB9787261.1 sigma 54-interacting transcriptional regulator [Deltaproteobacteria bacterium]